MSSTPSNPQIDATGVPTHVCINCGGTLFQIHAWFEDYDIAGWILNGTCVECDSPVTVPCPIDDPEFDDERY